MYGLIKLYYLLINVKKSAKIKDPQHKTRQISEKVKESIGPIGEQHSTVISQTNKGECYKTSKVSKIDGKSILKNYSKLIEEIFLKWLTESAQSFLRSYTENDIYNTSKGPWEQYNFDRIKGLNKMSYELRFTIRVIYA